MLRSLALVPVLVVALAGGCNSPRSTTPTLSPEVVSAATGDPFTLAEGESAEVADHVLRFVDVVEDSRCPEGVTCVWAGRAKVRLSASAPEDAEATQVLTLAYDGMTDDESATWTVGGVTVELLAVLPLPTSGDEGTPVREVELRVTAAE